MPGIEPKAGPCDQYSGAPAISGLPEAAMDYQRFLLHFEGRINRARYWLAVLIILCSMIFALLSLAIISAFFGIATGPLTIDIVGVSASFDLDPDTAVKVALFPQVVTIPMTLLFAWFYVSASVKRLHDRNKSGWWMIPFVGATGLYGQFGGWLGGAVVFCRTSGVRCHDLGLCRDVLPEGDERAQSVQARPATEGSDQAAQWAPVRAAFSIHVGPAKRD
jgi:uncharacterized membrane protein YhaH (DUF805 family)